VSPVLLRDLGMLHFMQRDWAGAEEIFSRLEETAPGFRGALYWRARLAIEQGRCEDAVRLLESRIAAGRANTRVTATVAYAWGRAGETGKARDILDSLVADSLVRRVPPVDLTMAYMGLQRWDEALDSLTKACQERAAALYQFAIDPLYDPIRHDPRAQTVRRSIGLPGSITPR
jgi:tetratricopeptide (TPR) repeat protein